MDIEIGFISRGMHSASRADTHFRLKYNEKKISLLHKFRIRS